MVFDAPPTSYDEIPFANDPYPASQPDQLATVATLFGLTPVRVDRCRVLELGCARGGNLIPLAVSLPGSRFVGIDSSSQQVAAARQVIEALSLGNIEVECLDILDVDARLGTFDYIICHGTYSWVPAAVRDKILEVCARNLAPEGLAYVSYNTYPGWHLRGLVRDLMCYHVRRTSRPQDRVAQARDLAADLLRSFHSNLVELHTHMPPFVLGVSERPVASPLARFQAAGGTTVTNLRHEAGQLNEFGRHVLRHLDGRHDRAAILERLVDLAR
jgi:SAM-dependent methyltransferase